MRKTLTAAALAASLIGGGTALFGTAAATAQSPAAAPDKGALLAGALSSLVADGTINQAQADAIANAFSAGHGHRAVRGSNAPAGDGDLAQRLADMRANGPRGARMTPPMKDSRPGPPAGGAGKPGHLASLVAEGTITQAQADAVAAALASLRPTTAWAPAVGAQRQGFASRPSGGEMTARAVNGRPEGGPAWAKPLGGTR